MRVVSKKLLSAYNSAQNSGGCWTSGRHSRNKKNGSAQWVKEESRHRSGSEPSGLLQHLLRNTHPAHQNTEISNHAG